MVYDIVVPRNSGQLDIIKFIHAKVGETFNFSKVSQLLPCPRLWTGPFPKTLGCTGFIFSKVMGRLFQGLCCFLFKGNAVLDYLLIGQQVQVVQHSFSKGAPCAWPLGAECHRHPAPIPWLLW